MTVLQDRAVQLLVSGMKTREVVTALGCSADTIKRAAAAYRAQGGELPHRHRGHPSILGNKLTEAVDLLRAGPAANGFPRRPGDRWMLPEVRRVLWEKYQVEYRGWVRAWCDRHGIRTSYCHFE
jgi:transposase